MSKLLDDAANRIATEVGKCACGGEYLKVDPYDVALKELNLVVEACAKRARDYCESTRSYSDPMLADDIYDLIMELQP